MKNTNGLRFSLLVPPAPLFLERGLEVGLTDKPLVAGLSLAGISRKRGAKGVICFKSLVAAILSLLSLATEGSSKNMNVTSLAGKEP